MKTKVNNIDKQSLVMPKEDVVNHVKLSVIVPVFEKEERIKKAIMSIATQTLSEIEIIIVWKKGKDRTECVLEEFSKTDKRIKLIEQTDNGGPGEARNIGLSFSTGEYVGFVDGDDYLDANYFENLYNMGKTYNADIAFGGMTGHEWSKVEEATSFFEKYKKIINGAVFDKIFKLEVVKYIRFPLGVFYEDNPWLLEAVWRSKLLITVPGTCYHYYEWDRAGERNRKLKESIPKIAKIYVDFISSNFLNKKEESLVKEKFFECVGGELCLDPDVFPKLVNVFGRCSELENYRKKRFRKRVIRRLFHISLKNRFFNILGMTFKF